MIGVVEREEAALPHTLHKQIREVLGRLENVRSTILRRVAQAPPVVDGGVYCSTLQLVRDDLRPAMQDLQKLVAAPKATAPTASEASEDSDQVEAEDLDGDSYAGDRLPAAFLLVIYADETVAYVCTSRAHVYECLVRYAREVWETRFSSEILPPEDDREVIDIFYDEAVEQQAAVAEYDVHLVKLDEAIPIL